MKLTSLLLITCLFCSLSSQSQTSTNLIPNHSFQYGSTNPNCNNPIQTLAALYDWKTAELDPESWKSPPTPDWYPTEANCNYVFCFNQIAPVVSTPNRFLGLSSNYDPGGEGIRVKLTNPLKSNTNYKFRIKCHFAPNNENKNQIRIHFAKKEDRWNLNDADNVRLSDAMTIVRTSDVPTCIWKVYEKSFSFGSDFDGQLKNIIIMAEDGYTFIDDVELYEYCTELIVRQNREYIYKEELEEATNIIAGEQITTSEPSGVVTCFNGSKLEYKAVTEVNLKPGFEVQRGSDFTARIAPCGIPCVLPTFACKTYQTLCANECINIGCEGQPLMAYQWTTEPHSNIDYLSCSNCPNPQFCPPANTTGIFTYKLRIINSCGEVKEETITINVTSTSNPSFTLSDVNLDGLPKLKVISDVNNTETVNIDILDCDNNILKSYTRDTKQTRLEFPLAWQLNGFEYDPCACYKIKVSTKNFCNENTVSETINWDLSNTPYHLNALQNVVSCASENLNRFFNVSAAGAKRAKIQFFDRWGTPMPPKTTSGGDASGWQDFKSNLLLYGFPEIACNGTYFYILEIEGCDGIIRTYHGSVTLINCCGEFMSPPRFDNNIYTYNENQTIKDSLYSVLLPNPVTETGTVNYHLPETSNVTISVFNSNMVLVSEIVNETKQKGDYQAYISTDNLSFGTNYYKINCTLSNGTVLSELTRFLVVK